MATTRSPSSNPFQSTANPNLKTPNSSNLLSKSTASLSKPWISSDSHLRSSFSKASPCASFEHKENEFDPNNQSKPSRTRSSKSWKNFMAPTISAASKVIAPSPRKKILQERNEVTPLSDSPLAPTQDEFVSKPEAGFGENAGVVMEFGLKAKMRIVSPDILDSRKVDSNIKKVPSFSPSPVVLAPLDADPSCPPYDPRPRFLHYRPNPRIDNYVSIVGELYEVGYGKRLEDSFSSESSHDDTVATSAELNSKPFKTLSYKRSKLLPFLLVMATACAFIPLSDSPIISSFSSSMLKEQAFTEIYNPPSRLLDDWYLAEYLSVANVKLYHLASRFKHWSSDSIANYFSSVAPSSTEIGLITGQVNLTFSDEIENVGSDFIYRHDTTIVQATEERSVEQPLPGEEIEVSEDVMEDNAEAVKDMEVYGNEKGAEFTAEQLEMEVPEDVNLANALIRNDAANIEIENSEQQIPFSQEVTESELVGNPQGCNDIQLAILGLSSAVLLLAANSAFLHMKKKKIPMVREERRETGKKVGSVFDSCRTYTTPAKGYPLEHFRANEDLMGDFGHSEASSSLNNTFAYGEHHQTKRGKEDASMSSERRLRSDSTASSLSYGSFTTYEKKGYKDEEVVTPVRRSNRLWNQVTSS